jgi:hypothetical protein
MGQTLSLLNCQIELAPISGRVKTMDNGVGLNNTIFTILNVFKTVLGWGKLSLIDTTDLSGLGATEKGAKGDRLLFN